MFGSLRVSLLAIFLSNESNNEGSKIRLDNIAKRRVTDTNPPNAFVPPKLEIINTENPKNNTIEV